MSGPIPSSIVYSCTFADYDYTLGPLTRTVNTRFIRFGNTRPNRRKIWQHKPIHGSLEKENQTLTNRNFKLFPANVLPECDVAIYVDGNILIRDDLSPIIKEFWDSGADIALFKHPSGRTLGQEIDFALEHKIPARDVSLTENQRQRYKELGLLDRPITENTIIFYRMNSSKVPQIGQLWWDELDQFCKRDQISLPYVLDRVAPKVHLWDWHFHYAAPDNPYFARHGHRQSKVLDRMRQVSHFMQDYSWEHRMIHKVLRSGGALRKFMGQGKP